MCIAVFGSKIRGAPVVVNEGIYVLEGDRSGKERFHQDTDL
jgi:hypothetical protein